MDKINVDTEESRRILETDNDIDDEQEHDMFTKEDEEAKDNIVKLSSYNFSKSPKKQEKSPSKKKLSRGMSFQTNPMEDDDINFGIRVYDGDGDDDDGSGDDFDDDANDEPIKKTSGMYGGGPFSDEDDEDEDEDDGESEDEDLQVEGVYDPREFEHLNVDPDVLGIFAYIQKYKPQTIILDYKLKPFIPDFIPAVGDIDAFIKVAPASDTRDNLGLAVLDEPAAGQSDPSVLDLQLRAVTKQTGAKKEARSKKVTGGEAVVTGKEVEQWIRDISDLHRSKPPPSVNYKHPMPEVDKIMQEWPKDVEATLQKVPIQFPDDPSVPLETVVDLMAGLLDIPVYRSRVEALHLMFSVYLSSQSQSASNLYQAQGRKNNGRGFLEPI